MKFILFVLALLPGTLACAQQLYTMPEGVHSSVSSFENLNGIKGNGGKTNHGAKGNAAEPLKAGESKVLLDVQSAGIIQRMWITVDNRSYKMLRSLRLRMYWDGAAKAAVDVPFGDFFCNGFGRQVAFQSALFSNPEGRSYNCYIPMPFNKSAKVVLTNEGDSSLALLYYDIDFVKMDKPMAGNLYFHASWNREITSALGKDFEMLPTVMGKGRFLGVSVCVNVDSTYRHTWWGEGEVKMYIDGDSKYPTINGTGTEDYIGTGWGESTFSNLYQGSLITDSKNRQYAFYRFHVPDQIFFYHDFKATLQKIGGDATAEVQALHKEGANFKPVTVYSPKGMVELLDTPMNINDSTFPDGWVNFYRVDDYCATAYFYLDKPGSNLPELAPLKDRLK